jgi:hypothetical protein
MIAPLEEATRLSDFFRYELLSLAILGLLSFSLWFFMTPSDSSAKGADLGLVLPYPLIVPKQV